MSDGALNNSNATSSTTHEDHKEPFFDDALNLFTSLLRLKLDGGRLGEFYVPLLINGKKNELATVSRAVSHLKKNGIVPMSGLTKFKPTIETFRTLTSSENWRNWSGSGGNNRTMLKVNESRIRNVIDSLQDCGLMNTDLYKILHSYLGDECELYSVMRIEPESDTVRDQKIHVDHMDVSGNEVSVAFSMRLHADGTVRPLNLGTMYFAGTHHLSRNARSAIMNTKTRNHNIEVPSGTRRSNVCLTARAMETKRQCEHENIQCLNEDTEQEIKKQPLRVCIMDDYTMIMEANGVHAGQARVWNCTEPPDASNVMQTENWDTLKRGDFRVFLTFRRKGWSWEDGKIGQEGNNNWPMISLSHLRPLIVQSDNSENGACDLVFRPLHLET